MAPRIIENLLALKGLVGQEIAVSDSFKVTQEKIQQFAETTEDRQWIHVDVERAKKDSPYRTPIAHGFLTLSLMSQFLSSCIRVEGVRMGVNYGLDRVRFPAPVPAGSNLRARIILQSVEDIERCVQAKYVITLECEASPKPACVAEWLVRYYP